MDITEVSIVHHIALVLTLLWIVVAMGWSHPVVFFVALLYLYKVNERYSLKLRRRLQFEERKFANQRRLLSDSESVRWLNHAVEKVWPICMEQIASQQFLLPIIPWFLDKYKPWTARKAVVQHLYLGRNPPMFTEIRVLGESSDDDHLVLELAMNFLSANDMSAILGVQLRKRLGFGIFANMHVTGMHVEGKVLVGVKFLRQWPFIGRVRICFVEPPYFQMTVKPIFKHGVDVTELPGIAGWLDKLLTLAFEQTLVEPNMLVVDLEKFASAPKEGWFSVDEKPPIAYVKVEIIEATDMKPSDLNGLADPYVRGQLGPYRFQTKIQKKTLTPKWLEEFKIPISSWEVPNVLVLQVRDKDHIFDDTLGDCLITINDLRGGQRHDKWLTLKNIKMGRLHLAITLLEVEDEKGKEHPTDDEEPSKMPEMTVPISGSGVENSSTDISIEGGQKMVDEFEPINIEGQEKTGIWVHHPGSDVPQTWEPRKGRERHPETQDIECTETPRSEASGSNHGDTNSSDEDGKHFRRIKTIGRGLRKIGTFVQRGFKKENPRRNREEVSLQPPDVQLVGEKGIKVQFILDDCSSGNSGEQKEDKGSSSSEMVGVESQGKDRVRDAAKNVIKQSAHSIKKAMNKKESIKVKEAAESQTAQRDDSSGSDLSDDATKDDPFVVGGSPIEIASPSEHVKESIKTAGEDSVYANPDANKIESESQQ